MVLARHDRRPGRLLAQRRPGALSLADELNLGPKTAERLEEVGVRCHEDLERLGSVEAYRLLKEAFPRATSLGALYALEGALLDIHWNELPPEVRERLRAQAALVA